MTAQNTAQDMQKTVEKVQGLVNLAQGEAASNPEAARTAAMSAVRIIAEEKLVCVPHDDFERAMKLVQQSQASIVRVKEEGKKNLLLGLALGFFGAKKF